MKRKLIMMLHIAQNRMVSDVQYDFNNLYPFLRLDFYKVQKFDEVMAIRKHLDQSTLLKTAGLKKDGSLEIDETMTVEELEKTFLRDFGLVVQISRKSGMMWLETTLTDNWTLQKQNKYGQEISLLAK